MKSMRGLVPILALGTCFLMATKASMAAPQSVVYTDSLTGSEAFPTFADSDLNLFFATTNVRPVLHLKQFDPSEFGVTAQDLRSVEIWFSGTVQTGGMGSYVLIFTQNTTVEVGVKNIELTATLPGGQQISVSLPDVSYPLVTTLGQTDLPSFNSEGGPDFTKGAAPQLAYTRDAGAILDHYVGTSAIAVDIMAMASSFYMSHGTGNGFSLVRTFASPKLAIRYTFVPEPSSLALIGIGLTAGVIAHRVRKRVRD